MGLGTANQRALFPHSVATLKFINDIGSGLLMVKCHSDC